MSIAHICDASWPAGVPAGVSKFCLRIAGLCSIYLCSIHFAMVHIDISSSTKHSAGPVTFCKWVHRRPSPVKLVLDIQNRLCYSWLTHVHAVSIDLKWSQLQVVNASCAIASAGKQRNWYICWLVCNLFGSAFANMIASVRVCQKKIQRPINKPKTWRMKAIYESNIGYLHTARIRWRTQKHRKRARRYKDSYSWPWKNMGVPGLPASRTGKAWT